MGLLIEQCVALRKGHLRYCCNQVWTMNGGRIPRSATAICEILRDFYLMWKAVRNTIKRTSNAVWSNGRISPNFCERPIEITSIWSKSLARYIPWICVTRGWNLERRQTLKNWSRWTHLNSTPRRLKCQRIVNAMKGKNSLISKSRWNGQTFLEKIKFWEHPPWSGIAQNEERNKKFFEENRTDSLLQHHIKMTQHWMMRTLKMISGLLRETSFIAITWNPESHCTYDRNHLSWEWWAESCRETCCQSETTTEARSDAVFHFYPSTWKKMDRCQSREIPSRLFCSVKSHDPTAATWSISSSRRWWSSTV